MFSPAIAIIPVVEPLYVFEILTFSKLIFSIFVVMSFIKPTFSSLNSKVIFFKVLFPFTPSSLAIVTFVFILVLPEKSISAINL